MEHMKYQKEMTIAQSLYGLVKAEFKIGNTRINKAVITEWVVPYVEKVGGEFVMKKGSADSRARKLRLLVESNYLGAEYENGQCFIVPAVGYPKPIDDDSKDEPEGTPEAEIAPVSVYHGHVRWDGRMHHFFSREKKMEFLKNNEGSIDLDI